MPKTFIKLVSTMMSDKTNGFEWQILMLLETLQLAVFSMLNLFTFSVEGSSFHQKKLLMCASVTILRKTSGKSLTLKINKTGYHVT